MAKKRRRKWGRRLLNQPPPEAASATSLWLTLGLLGLGVVACAVGLLALDSSSPVSGAAFLAGFGSALVSASFLVITVGERRRNLVRAEILATELRRSAEELRREARGPGGRREAEVPGRTLGGNLDSELHLAQSWRDYLIEAEAFEHVRSLDAAIGEAQWQMAQFPEQGIARR